MIAASRWAKVRNEARRVEEASTSRQAHLNDIAQELIKKNQQSEEDTR